MNRLLKLPAEQLTAVVAAWAILVAPLASLSNCCCLAWAAAAHDAAAPAEAAADRLAPVSCCAAEPTDACVSEPVPACCAPAAATAPRHEATAQSCSCPTSCCHTNISQATAVVNPASQQITSFDWIAVPVALLAPLPRETRSTWSEVSPVPDSLSAHARCALLCRWLN